jgi:hypothetical protein
MFSMDLFMNVVSVKRLKVSIHVYNQLFDFSYEIYIQLTWFNRYR